MIHRQRTSQLRRTSWTLAAASGFGAMLLHAQAVQLSQGHADIGIGFEEGRLEPHIHLHEPPPDGTEYAPDQAILLVSADAKTTVPSNPTFSFLGMPGDTLWALPQAAKPNVLFLGLGAEEIEPGLFEDNTLQLSLTAFQGPGAFSLYRVDALGQPAVYLNTRDGVSRDQDTVPVIAGSHGHATWAFSAPGAYEITLVASGTLADTTLRLESEPATYRFEVVPEPGVFSLGLLGGLLLIFRPGRSTPSQPTRALQP